MVNKIYVLYEHHDYAEDGINVICAFKDLEKLKAFVILNYKQFELITFDGYPCYYWKKEIKNNSFTSNKYLDFWDINLN